MSTFIFMVSVHLCVFSFYQIEANLAIWDDCLGLLGGGSPLTDPENTGYSHGLSIPEKSEGIVEEKTPSGYILNLFNAI